ncbi:hypothetical protein C9374_002876 [Naegleria lovaniensis]|uniref:SAM domain-containing protein n=1 Tax=Naegleria lovaniensis TaxID=51637 RepID=A0AA88GT74_NAELO|nr:uncharacterized protein C9374_014294 [Naegleria lovaniensis]XP_044550422.1 uncharacterized protein C9374_002876 [Naegleria lovaniensis]KAG2370718.1 hypothetical protein C9374_014294 [Naegleria lovaniensis]KAG2386430.1 hypothetical protein C9374_002876 [Naegleria lovaniensis]
MNLFKLKSTTSTHEFVPDVTHIAIKNWTSENFKHWLMSEKYDQKTVIDVLMKQQLTGNAILCLTKDLTEFKVPTGAAISIIAKLDKLRQEQEEWMQQPQTKQLFSLSYPSATTTTEPFSNSENHESISVVDSNENVDSQTSPRAIPKQPQTPTVQPIIHHAEQDHPGSSMHSLSGHSSTIQQISPRNHHCAQEEQLHSTDKVSPRRDHHPKPLPTLPHSASSSTKPNTPIPPMKRSSSVQANGTNPNNNRLNSFSTTTTTTTTQQQQPILQQTQQQSPRQTPPQYQPPPQQSSPTNVQQDHKNTRSKKFVDAGFFPEDEL